MSDQSFDVSEGSPETNVAGTRWSVDSEKCDADTVYLGMQQNDGEETAETALLQQPFPPSVADDANEYSGPSTVLTGRHVSQSAVQQSSASEFVEGTPCSSGGKEVTAIEEDDDEWSEEGWKPSNASALEWLNRQMMDGIGPAEILWHLLPNAVIPEDIDPSALWHLIIQVLGEPPKRKKLPHYNTLDDALELLQKSSKIVVVTGAGVSVSCGIPDFRSKDGIYMRLHKDFPDLPDPQAMFDINYFGKNPGPFFEFAKEIYPGQYQPSLCHKFIKVLEDKGKLLRNYTQNIDTLEQVAGITRVVQCHGSFATASCCACKYKVDSDDIRSDIFEKKIPRCPKCPAEVEFAVMKPDVVFFGESLPSHFHEQISSDKDEVDLLIVIGSSMKVKPVALIPSSVDPEIAQILINREVLDHLTFDIELLGNCDDILEELCFRLGQPWSNLCHPGKMEPFKQCLENELLTANPASPGLPEVLLEDVTSTTTDCEPHAKKSKVGSSEEVELDPTNSESLALAELRGMYKPRYQNLASLLPNNSFLYFPPNRYVFHGAEFFRNISEEEEKDISTSSVSPSDNHTSKLREEKEAGSESSNLEYRNGSPTTVDVDTSSPAFESGQHVFQYDTARVNMDEYIY